MDFTFTNDQLMFREEVSKFLANKMSSEYLRSLWDTDTGRDNDMWQELASLGLTSITVPEEHGGLGLTVEDFILLAQECGHYALPEPLVHNVMVAVPFLLKLNNETLNQRWLQKIAEGQAKVVVAVEGQEFVEDVHTADLLVMEKQGAFYEINKAEAMIRFNPSVDPSRRLYTVEFDINDMEKLIEGDEARKLSQFVRNSGALGVAAQALGLAQRMIDLSVQYTADREQFGVAIGTFQAVKHLMANVAYKLEYAKAPTYRAANALAHDNARSTLYVSHAKMVACEAADLAAKNSMQVHGAMGYTWEMDLHIFMKKAWAFKNAWGDMAYLKNRIADFVLKEDALLGAENTFI